MKKTSIVTVLAAAAIIVVFQSFKSNAPVKAETMDANAISFQNMQDAFKGETTASAKYAAYSKKAEEEGFHEIALLFNAASKSEKIHATNHLSLIHISEPTRLGMIS